MANPDNGHPVRFGIITDIHFSTGNETAAAHLAAADLRNCIEGWKKKEVNLLLQLGDLIQGSEAHKQEEFLQVHSILKTFPGAIRHVIGNHCLALPREELLAALGLQRAFYSFTLQEFRFIVLDGMDISVLRQPETPQERQILASFLASPELHDYCGAVGIKQKRWLQRELQVAEHSNEKVIIICHFPLLPETTDQKHGLLWNHREISELLLSSAAVKACLSGHYHYGAYALLNGIHFIVLPAFVNRTAHPRFACGTVELQSKQIVIQNQLDETLYDLPLRH